MLPGQQLLLPPNHNWQRQQALTALQGPDMATDVQVADFISKADTRAWSLMSHLLKPCQQQQQSAPAGLSEVDAAPASAVATGAADRAASEPSGVSISAGPSSGPTTSSSPSLQLKDPDAGDSSSSQELMPVRRGKRRRLLQKGSSADSDEDLESLPNSTGAAAAAESLEDSDWEDDFEPEPAASRAAKRARKVPADAAEGGDGACNADTEAAAGSDSYDSDVDEQDPAHDGQQAAATTAAVAAAAAAASAGGDTAAAAQQLLAHIVRQFRLNPAQAAVAAHVADWLPQLMHDVQQRQQNQQQAKGRGAVRPKISALTANRALAAPGHAIVKSSISSSSGSTGGSSRPPVCLIHGPFGSGKSTLLVALIHLLTELPAPQVSCIRGYMSGYYSSSSQHARAKR